MILPQGDATSTVFMAAPVMMEPKPMMMMMASEPMMYSEGWAISDAEKVCEFKSSRQLCSRCMH